MKKITLLGVGAVGGGLLCKNPKMLEEIKVAVTGARKERMQKDGIVVNDVQYFPQIAEKEPQDIVLVAVKNTQLQDVLGEMQQYMGEDTIIVPLMNGISAVEVLQEAFPNQVVVPTVVYVDAQKYGNRIKCSEKYMIEIGGVKKEVLETLQTLFTECDVVCKIREDIQRYQWKKFMANIGTNQVSAITGATYGNFISMPEVAEAAKAAMEEVLAVAVAMGINLFEEDVDNIVNNFKNWNENGKSSMLQDVEANRITEVDVFAGKLVALGKSCGVATPINQTLYWLLCAKQKIYTQS